MREVNVSLTYEVVRRLTIGEFIEMPYPERVSSGVYVYDKKDRVICDTDSFYQWAIHRPRTHRRFVYLLDCPVEKLKETA